MKKRSLSILLLGALLALAGLAVGSAPARAQDPQPTPSDNDVNRVAKEMYCPVCENIPLDVCPTQACTEWRELIRLKLSEGLTDQEIKEYFAVQYGDRVLSEPPRRGLNWLVYVLPLAAIVVGAGVVLGVILSMRRAPRTRFSGDVGDVPPPPASPGAAANDPYLARVEEELKKQEDR